MITLRAIKSDGKTIYTYFHNGIIVELPTRWLRFLSHEPRFSSLTIRQYASAAKDLFNWVIESGRYGTLWLDSILTVVTRKDLQQWLQDRKAAGLNASTLRNREVIVKSLFDWLTTADGGHIRPLQNTPYRSGKLISAAPTQRRPRYVAVEELIALLGGYYNESERTMVHAIYDVGLRISEVVRLSQQDLPEARFTTTEIYTAIPPSVLAKLNSETVVTDKYKEAKQIYDATWLPPRKHIEKRGHRNEKT